MLRLLVLLLSLSASLVADDCSVPGVVDFFPLTSSAAAECHPGVYDLTSVNSVIFNTCSYCGPSAALGPISEGGSGELDAPASLCAAMSNLSIYTLEFDYSVGPLDNGNFPASYIFSENYSDESSVQNNNIQIGSDGNFSWGNDDAQSVIASDFTLSVGQCYHLSFISDGSFFYIYVDGQMAGGPVARNSKNYQVISGMSITGPYGQSISNSTPAFFRNLRFSSVAQFPTQLTPVTASCISPTETQTPGGCPISVLKPPDLTEGAPHTVLETCTPAQTETLTPTETETPSPSATVTVTPEACLAVSCPRAEVSSYKMCGQTWSGQPMGTSSFDICPYGCILTCFSMVLNQDPSKAVVTLADDIDSEGNLSFIDAASTAGKYSDNKTIPYSIEGVEKSLCRGEIPIVYVKRWSITQKKISGHYVVVTGEDTSGPQNTCRIKINDPGESVRAAYNYLDAYEGTAPGTDTPDGQEIISFRILYP